MKIDTTKVSKLLKDINANKKYIPKKLQENDI